MSINTIAAAIAAICNGTAATVDSVTYTINGIDPPPAQLSTAKLPCAYTLTGEAQYDLTHGADILLETRQYRVQCAIEASEQMYREKREKVTRALIVALRDKLAGYPNLRTVSGSTAGVLNAAPTGDSGPIIIQDSPNTEYVGFEMTLQVSELISRTYAALE
jgi:hypothetical protein